MRKLKGIEKRVILYVIVLVAVLVWSRQGRRWSPDITLETDHYTILSTATQEQTEEIGRIAECLYDAYMKFLVESKLEPKRHGKLKIKLFKDRTEFRWCNNLGDSWAEAFYSRPYCYQYYSADEENPYHWMVHEGTHQLNEEVADLSLTRWLEEGIATYISTSRIINSGLTPGKIDRHTYPVWWIQNMARRGDFAVDISHGCVIPLKAIVSGVGGPPIDRYFNMYYLHWWTLVHFLIEYEDGKYRPAFNELVRTSGTLRDFEQHIGKVDDIEKEWYSYVRALRAELLGLQPPVVTIQNQP